MDNQTVKIGDVFVYSWGYEQTNVDYYQVVGLKGKATVLLRKIAKVSGESISFFSGYCTPAIDEFIGEVFAKRLSKCNTIKMEFGSAFLKDYQIVDDKKTFKPDYCSYGY